MSTEYLYRKDSKTGFWKCSQGGHVIKNDYSLHLLLTHAAHAEKSKYNSCRVVYFNEEEEKVKP